MNFGTIAKWFSGKALKNAESAFAILEASVAQGFWTKGGGIKVTSKLDKQAPAKKWAKTNEKALCTIGLRPSPYAAQGDKDFVTFATPSYLRGWEIVHLMTYGNFKRAQMLDFAALRGEVATAVALEGTRAELMEMLDYAEGWVKDFAEVAAAIQKLDATKPKPVFTNLGVSPTVTSTLTRLGFDPNAKLEMPVMEDFEVERVIKGRKMWVTRTRLVWPEGTVHGASIHAQGNKCHACGHAIRNGFNWVPLVLRTLTGEPRSFMVGRDCAMNLFRIKMDGDLDLV